MARFWDIPLLLLLSIAFGSAFAMIKVAVPVIGPEVLVIVRCLIGASVLILVALILGSTSGLFKTYVPRYATVG